MHSARRRELQHNWVRFEGIERAVPVGIGPFPYRAPPFGRKDWLSRSGVRLT